jgi:hypothetical protein
VAWIVDVELVEVAPGELPDVWTIVFDVIYPGETWCRSLVRLSPASSQGNELELVGRARDALLAILELQAGPASADIRVAPEGTTVLRLGSPDLL